MTQKTKTKPQNNRTTLILIGVVVAAVVVAVLFIVLSGANNSLGGATIDYSEIPQGRTEDGAFILGNPDAPLTIVAFEDFLCPHCQGYQPEIKKFIQESVATGEAQFEFRMLQTQSVSDITFQLAQCAGEFEDSSFWTAHDTLFQIAASRSFSTSDTPRDFANQLGVNYAELLDCMADADQYVTDGRLASQVQVSSTPTLMMRVNGSAPQALPVGPRPTGEQLNQFAATMQ